MLNAETQASSESSSDQAPRRVCIQGYAGAFHEIAARLCFNGTPIEVVPSHTFDELVQKVEEKKEVDFGIMAIENTLAGSLMYNYSLLNDSSLQVVGEVFLRIRQNLMAWPGQTIQDIEEVHSHPIAIAQCREFFRDHPHIRLVEMEDTALSAKLIREKELRHIGAIASTLAAELYDMEILAPGIETNKKNHTRFLILDHKDELNEVEGPEKVSLCFSVDHSVGSLYKALAVLAAYNINLTKIQSRPLPNRSWEYLFFVDFEGHVDDPNIEKVVHSIGKRCMYFRVLGSYPSNS